MTFVKSLFDIVLVGVRLLQVIYWYIEAIFRQFVPPPMKYIDGETILVTGAASGIGKEICRYIVKCGDNIKLVMWDLNINELENLARELKSVGRLGLQVYSYQVDISTRENIDICCKQVKKQVGPVTIIFNNAGVVTFTNFLQTTNEQIENTIQVNLLSHLWIIRQFLPEMVARNHGRIINTCSLGGLKAVSHALPYFASKFGVNGYMEGLKAELALFGHDGIHCTTVYPYFVQTPLLRSLTLDESKVTLPGIRRFLDPAKVAKQMVDGMRREYEYIYLPRVLSWIIFAEYFAPNKLRKAITLSQIRIFSFKDADEQKNFDLPFDTTLTCKSRVNANNSNETSYIPNKLD